QRQTENGIPQQAQQFAEKVDTADLVIMSLAEHNGSYTVAFKNIFDWISRIPSRTAWNNTPLFVMATSPGGRGGAGVLQAATQSFPHYGGNVVESFSLPFFCEKFDS
ncbi:MAG: NAD(P)H-dependent oxidoreductase, partial [Bergeyella zoohelcum]|nr:NAD(P)H-dependent oxidoreductase [Bergeyella zoohelcum]